MTDAIMASLLLALLAAWGLAVCQDLRRGRRSDLIGAILDAWLEPCARCHPRGAAEIVRDATAQSQCRHIPTKEDFP